MNISTIEFKIGILGGTFNPPTWGHYKVAQAALDSRKVDYIEFLPCWKHAFNKKPVDFSHRVEMCKLLIGKNKHMDVSDLEGKLKTTYSIDILEEYINNWNLTPIRGLYKNIKFRLVMGADNYLKMDKWKNPERVKELAPPLWIGRPGINDLPETEEVIELDNTLSSTQLREELKSDDPKALLHTRSTVVDYIKLHNLY